MVFTGMRVLRMDERDSGVKKVKSTALMYGC
jgi:hypothetical protein